MEMKYANESIFDIDERGLSHIGGIEDSRAGSYQHIQRCFKLDFPPSERQIKRVTREQRLKYDTAKNRTSAIGKVKGGFQDKSYPEAEFYVKEISLKA